IMRWLHEQRIDFSFLMTTEPDMALLKEGFVPGCEAFMDWLQSAYLGVLYGPRVVEEYPIGLTERKWERSWRPIVQTAVPSRVLNPGQVFGAAYVEKLMAFPLLDELMNLADETGVWAPEEFIYPTM